MIGRTVWAAIAVLVLAGCAQQRPALMGSVAIPARMIPANLNQMAGAPAHHVTPAPTAMAVAVRDARAINSGRQALCTRLLTAAGYLPDDRVQGGTAIVLSGGSENGAFGAGLFLGLQDIGQFPGEPAAVTGVSTGALQSTFVFLAGQRVPGDRDYGWIDRSAAPLHALPGVLHSPPLLERRSNLEDLALAYSIAHEGQILKVSPTRLLSVATNGTEAVFTPLRARLLGLISRQTITDVATQACRGRVLLVGVADVDDGNGYALDMTALALRAFNDSAQPVRMEPVRQTYVSALLASSSVPVGALPVSLLYRELSADDDAAESRVRHHLFIDGGARFGVFAPDAADGDTVTLVVNTTLATKPWTPGDPDHPTTTWSIATLALRAVNDLLENQVYQLSVGKVEQAARHLRMAYISNQNLHGPDGKVPQAPDEYPYGANTCSQWYTQDQKQADPLQFYPNYMACLLDYGRARGQQPGPWNLVVP
jgi:hypothetical protein